MDTERWCTDDENGTHMRTGHRFSEYLRWASAVVNESSSLAATEVLCAHREEIYTSVRPLRERSAALSLPLCECV